jgi:hypothetical protein
MRKPFTPLREDGRPRWKVIFDMAVAADYGDTITYDEIAEELDTDDRKIAYREAHKAVRHLWETEQRSLGVIPDVGYKVLRPDEHMDQAMGFKKQSRRKLGNAVAVMHSTNLAKLPDEATRGTFMQAAAMLVMSLRALHRHEEELARHEDMIAKLGEDRRTADERISTIAEQQRILAEEITRMKAEKKDD